MTKKNNFPETLNVSFLGYKCKVMGGMYKNKQKAIQLIDAQDGSPIAVATVCMVNETINEDEVFIKDYSENEGITDVLIKAGIIFPEIIKTVNSGFVKISAYKLTLKALMNLFPK